MFDSKRRIDSFEGAARLSLEDTWTPVRIVETRGGECSAVVWANIGHGPFEAALFDTDLVQRLENAPWFSADLGTLSEYAFRSPGVSLKGIVWHMSRCGSTLARNLLGAVDASVAISEPVLINALSMKLLTEGRTPEPREALQSALGCFVRPDGNRLLRAYLKCTSWTVLIAGTMAECTPSVPGVFIHRDPLLVLASIHRAAPGWAQSGSDLAARFGIVSSADPLEQAVHFLAAFLRSALDAEAHGILKLVAYPNILDRFINGDLPAYFGYEVDEATRVRMIAAAKYHSKEPGRRFVADEDKKRAQAEATPGLVELVERELGDLYQEVLARSGY